MPSAENLARRVDRWIMASEDARRLAAVRIGLCIVLAARMATTDYDDFVARPNALFEPVSYMKLLAGMPSHELATTLQWCGIIAALMAAAGLAIRAALPVVLACSLVLEGMVNSSGRVIVGDAVLTLGVIILLASGRAATEAWTIRDAERWMRKRQQGTTATESAVVCPGSPAGARYGWPLRTLMITISLAYFFAGFQKLRYSGIRWVTSDNLRWVLYASSDRHAHPNALALFIASQPDLAYLLAAGSLALEVGFPVILFVPQLRWIVIPGVILMHVFVRAALGLDYSTQWLTVVIAFVDWPALVDWFQGDVDHRQRGQADDVPIMASS